MKFSTYISIVFLSVGLYACSDDDLINSHLKKGQIEIVVTPSYDYDVSFAATADKITIYWGDDRFDILSPNGVMQTFSHQYINQDKHTIRIESEKLVQFSNTFDSRGFRVTSNTFNELYIGEMNALEMLDIRGEFTVLEIKKANALKELLCWGKLTSLDLRGVRGLTSLNCSFNQLTSLNVRDFKKLTSFNCENNRLTSLDVRGLTALKEFGCTGNQLTSLDIRDLKALTLFHCYNNQLTSLDVSNLTALETLMLDNNQLTSLDVRGLSVLKELGCNVNRLTSNALNSLFESLPDRPAKDGSIRIYNNPGSVECNRAIATNKGWTVNPVNY